MIVLYGVLYLGCILFLIWSEIGSNDCLRSWCRNKTPSSSSQDSRPENIDKSIETLRRISNTVIWRRSLLIALISTLFILLFLRSFRLPLFFAILGIIFFISYICDASLESRWFFPQAKLIEHSLLQLRK